jgi:hypothetical protein
MARRIAYCGDPPLTKADLTAWLQETSDTVHGAVVDLIIPAVVAQCETITGAAIRPAIYEEVWHVPYRFGGWLDIGQVVEVTSVKRLDSDVQIAADRYVLQRDMRQASFRLLGGEQFPIRIEYKAGVDLVVHPQVKAWLLMQAAALYAQRETLTAEKLNLLPDGFINTMLADITVPARF